MVLMREPNFLVLDEPTNDLDIMTLAVLEDYLANFKGCVMAVSHDRYFLDRVADHLFVFEGDGKVRDFPGDYSNYRHCVAEEEKTRKAEAAKSAKADGPKGSEADRGKPRTGQKPKLTFKEKRELEELEVRIPELEKEKKELETSMNSGNLDHEALREAAERFEAVSESLDEAELRYLELLEKA